jgi:4-diphosphocytidyl-2-C-methyl-D-erythritol kinase
VQVERAPAKINLTLKVLGLRADDYHELESLVVFAQLSDRLQFIPGETLALEVGGRFAEASGPTDANLVLKAARELARRVKPLKVGRFRLLKRLPVAAGIGGGSADAAAALRLLARVNAIGPGDPRLAEAARATGADVLVCLDPRPRLMWGIGEALSEPLRLEPLPSVLVNCGIPVPTKKVFAALRAPPCGPVPQAEQVGAKIPYERDRLVQFLREHRNELEAAAILIAPEIAAVLRGLAATKGCELARMSGSGGTCFGLFRTTAAARIGMRQLRAARPHWWVRAAVLG